MTGFLENIVYRLIEKVLKKEDAMNSLCFLFRLENYIYKYQGVKAVEYGGGVHTKHRHTKYHDFFISRIPGNSRVLDIGCGNGALAYDIAQHSKADVIAIDINELNIEKAKSTFSHPFIRYIVADATQYVPDESLDIIVLSNVLEHLHNRVAFLQRIQNISSANKILIRVPMFERDWRIPLKKELGLEWRLDLTHETEYTVEEFSNELNEAGLTTVHQEFRWGEIWAECHRKGCL